MNKNFTMNKTKHKQKNQFSVYSEANQNRSKKFHIEPTKEATAEPTAEPTTKAKY